MGNRPGKDYEKGGSSKLWCWLLLIALVVAIVVIVVLALTVFRIRDPRVTVQSVQVMSFDLTFLTSGPQLSFTMTTVWQVKNRDDASFNYDATTAYIFYRGHQIGSFTIPAGVVHQQKTATIATTINVSTVNFLGNPTIAGDVQSGNIPLTVQTTLSGRIKVAGIEKHHATVTSTCNFGLLVQTQSVGDITCSSSS